MADNNYLDVIEVLVRSRFKNQIDMFNVWRMRVDDTSGFTNAQVLTDMQTWVTGIVGQQDDIQWNQVYYQAALVSNFTQNRIIGTVNTPRTTGLKSTQPLPTGIAGLITFFTAQPGYRARKYVGGLTIDNSLNRRPAAEAITKLTNMANYFAGRLTLNTRHYYPGVWSFKNGAFYLVTRYVVSSEWAHQRRRRLPLYGV
jgi:hypothetical protein